MGHRGGDSHSPGLTEGCSEGPIWRVAPGKEAAIPKSSLGELRAMRGKWCKCHQPGFRANRKNARLLRFTGICKTHRHLQKVLPTMVEHATVGPRGCPLPLWAPTYMRGKDDLSNNKKPSVYTHPKSDSAFPSSWALMCPTYCEFLIMFKGWAW